MPAPLMSMRGHTCLSALLIESLIAFLEKSVRHAVGQVKPFSSCKGLTFKHFARQQHWEDSIL